LVDDLRRLLELQKLDDELHALEQEQRALPGRREAMAAEQAAAEERLAAAREAVRAAEATQRQAERDLQDREAAAAKLEGQQHQVKTNEAYTALLREIDHAREAASACETRILEAMESIEAASEAAATAEADAKATRDRVEALGRSLAAREAELAERIDGLQGQRAEARGRVDRALAELYDRISARKRPAIVAVTREICTGCRVDIPPQTFLEIRARARVVTCGRCQRILVLADA
jgi:predicted  nucleic acid-binding Zn-ribbon protein